MKRLSFALILVCLCASAAGSALAQDQAAQPKTNFRQSAWGDSSAAVKALEKAEPADTTKSGGLDVILYMGKAGTLDCAYGYMFAEDKLVKGRYLFTEKHSNNNQYITDYENVKKNLIDKYGNPQTDKVIWKNNLYKDDQDDWGFAVSLGHLVYRSEWTTDETRIVLILSGDNHKILHSVYYVSTIAEHADLMNTAAEKAKNGIW